MVAVSCPCWLKYTFCVSAATDAKGAAATTADTPYRHNIFIFISANKI
jgi:hypothetical protein